MFTKLSGRKKALAVTGIVLLIPIVALSLWAIITLSYSYSSGDRAGILQKFSERGWVCKTWEGELLMSAVPGSAPEKFLFSVRSDSVAEEINKLNGQRVVLHYEQHRAVPTSCFGDTEYFVTAVRAMADSAR
jgi:hypothetical protein